MNVTAHQEEKKNKETKMGKRKAGEKKENKRPILRKLCAALLRSFRGSIAKK